MVVIALHTAYLATLIWPGVTPGTQMAVALAAYGLYVVNAAQYIVKLRRARLERAAPLVEQTS